MSFLASGRKDIFLPTEITNTVWGIAPWSDELLQISGDVSRGRRPDSDYDAQLARDFTEYERVLNSAEIDYRSGGWGGGTHDYLRDIVLNSSGFGPGIDQAPVTRWFDTNTFYRRPTLRGPLHYYDSNHHGSYIEPWAELNEAPSTYQPTLLSPYAFARLSDHVSGLSENEADGFVGQLYDQLLDNAARHGVQRVLLHEPYAAYNQINEKERKVLKRSIGRLAANHQALELGVYFSFGDASSLLREFTDEDHIAAIGCDLQKTPLLNLPEIPSQRFIAGLVDGANTLIRNDEELLAELAQVSLVTGSPEVSITHTVDLEHVPRSSAIDKIGQLGRLAWQYKEAA